MNNYQFSGYRPNFQQHQQSAPPFASMPSSSPRPPRPNFGFNAAPFPYPRPRSSASKPNPGNQEPHYNQYEHRQHDANSSFNDSLNGNRSYVSESDDASFVTCPDTSFHNQSYSYGNDNRSFNNQSFNNQSYGYGNNNQPQTPNSFNPSSQSMKNYVHSFEESQTYPSRKAIMDAAGANNKPSPFNSNKKRPLKRKAPSAPQIQYRCDTCNLDFTSQISLNMHLTGARHAKKLKAIETLQSLRFQGHASAKDTDTQTFRCEICDISLNGALQLQMHFEGTKHKNKLREKNPPEMEIEENGKDVKKAIINMPVKSEPVEQSISADSDDCKPAKLSKFSCEICNVIMNSETQLQQHLSSKKHMAKMEGKPVPKKNKKIKMENDGETMETVESNGTTTGIIPLTSSFHKAEVLNAS